MKRWIHANTAVGRHRGIDYGMESNPPQRYYFVKPDGSVEYGETEDEIEIKIDGYVDGGQYRRDREAARRR